ncbi:transglutaminase family protein [Piscinibacter sp. XHJ-5]|uniref:transglutaminase family protein n=1 Tax=Piscinibacter sp. XHJ-5 TaxID=3037797 RepID=UPI0024536EC3|nr:transglutaminase family protein [Piscinibacter sp. XHJ-5]
MRLSIHHETQYEYSAPLRYSTQSIRLTPQASEHQTVLHWSVQVPGKLFSERDGYGNHAHTWTLARRLRHGAIRAGGLVETHASPWLVDAPGLPSPLLYLRSTDLTPFDLQLRTLGADMPGSGVGEQSLLALARLVCERVPYRAGSTGVHTTALQALQLGAGVCQDQAHVFIAACRANGVPARYVSGYFYAPESPALASHAWADVCVHPGERRWLSVDVTHGCLMDERHVRLAVGPDYAACLPIRGVRHGGGEEAMRVRVEIRPS